MTEQLGEVANALSPGRRRDDMARLGSGELDVLVVGGGITGAGIALDAATRGLSVGLVEAQDWAAGTSSRSSKLIHGGLRYLQMLDFHLVRQGLKERALIMQRLAPHLVRPVPIMWPLRKPVVERIYVGAGIALYDLLGLAVGARRGLPLHRHLSKRHALALSPGLRPDALAGAILYYDGQVDDARYVVEVVRTAVSSGAVAVNRAEAVRFLREGERVVGAVLRDTETGEELEARARVNVIATGAWTEETEGLAGRDRAVRVRPSKGAHLVVAREKLALSSGLIVRTDRSVLFVLPWGEHWLIGTTDTDWEYGKARPLATSSDVGYLIAQLNRVLAQPLAREDVEATFAGLRPLVAGGGVVRGPGEGQAKGGPTQTPKLSREHTIGRQVPGLVVVSGGKYTTYRLMAAEVVDAAVADGSFRPSRSQTGDIPLLGAIDYHGNWDRRHALAAEHGIGLARAEHLLHRYGGLVGEVLSPIRTAPRLAGPVEGAPGYLQAELVYAVTHEGARHLEDVLMRRTRIAMETSDGGVGSALAAAQLLAPLLGWDDATLAAEVEDYRSQVALGYRAASRASDDAGAARLAEEAPARLPLP
ncbi:MAG TPA: glycerol-3-phosphate dehydrogenase/oxidase [Acidimicrobiales bacterium]|nr:glycerol-3-phosphate dehydrogenase/oxidase [Acidimicrobiales bacterium]